jgi:hypothetical protein
MEPEGIAPVKRGAELILDQKRHMPCKDHGCRLLRRIFRGLIRMLAAPRRNAGTIAFYRRPAGPARRFEGLAVSLERQHFFVGSMFAPRHPSSAPEALEKQFCGDC